ncbi:MAG: hypothetical protein ACRDOU_09005 [Streptosporangiaceae bacterium]
MSMSRPDAEALRIFLRLVRPQPLADPYPLYTRLRDLAPFLPIRLPGSTRLRAWSGWAPGCCSSTPSRPP